MPARKIDRQALKQLLDDGLTAAQIADWLHCSEHTVWRARKELGLAAGNNPMTPERRARIKAMLDDGWSWEEIHRTEGANWDTMTRHFPGTQWSRQQIIQHATATRHGAIQLNTATYANTSQRKAA